MSGFSADWLALREPADRRARAAALEAALAARLASVAPLSVVDLGCGTGSNLRALAPKLGARQSWLLVDRDPALLAAARRALAHWADRAETRGEGLLLAREGREIAVAFRLFDLSSGAGPLLDPAPGLVTAAALFDLVSAPWIRAFAREVAARAGAFHTALAYDGHEVWTPPHPADGAMLAAFHAHQRRDKGFGPAAGPAAGAALRAAFEAAGWTVDAAASPWRLGGDDRAMIEALAHGAADAVAETGLVPAPEIAAWRAARIAAETCEIGHTDLVALPAGRR